MVIVTSYAVAVLMCVITMLCWGSWANMQKLASKEWRFQLFYWDYCLGVLLLTLLMAFTLGSNGSSGRGFLDDLSQASGENIGYALLGGVIFNIANILLVAAIDIAGMAVAFPIGIGLALVIGVVTTYLANPSGNPVILFAGVAAVAVAIVLDALAYRKLPSSGQKTTAKGIVLSILCGILMGQFFQCVVWSMPEKLTQINDLAMAGKLTPYTALVFFALGLFLSSFVFNTMAMLKPFVGEPVPLGDYFTKGNARLHLVGIVGGMNVSTLADLSGASNVSAVLSASTGYHVGLFAELGPLRPSLLYLNAGSMFDGAAFIGTTSFTTSYLVMPIDLKLSVLPVLYFVGGPEFRLKASSGAPADFNDDLKSLVVHGGAGMGVQAGPLHLEARYVFGLSSITPDSYTVGTTTVTAGGQTSQGIRVSTGIKF